MQNWFWSRLSSYKFYLHCITAGTKFQARIHKTTDVNKDLHLTADLLIKLPAPSSQELKIWILFMHMKKHLLPKAGYMPH